MGRGRPWYGDPRYQKPERGYIQIFPGTKEPERGHIRQNHPFTKQPFSFLSKKGMLEKPSHEKDDVGQGGCPRSINT